jgi:hypothetical protein
MMELQKLGNRETKSFAIISIKELAVMMSFAMIITYE